jgi:hypothetical protein
MAATAAPYGLRPVKRLDGMSYAGSITQYLIDPAGEATNIFNGQVVYLGTDGYIAIVTATGADATTNAWPAGSSKQTGAIGVFVGCEYVNAQGQLIHSQYYPSAYAAPTGTSIKAYVIDDPNVLFQAQLDAGSMTQAAVGQNTCFAAVQSTSTGSTRTGNSTSALDATIASTTMPFRIVSFVSPVGDAYPDVLVKFNPTWHTHSVSVALS